MKGTKMLPVAKVINWNPNISFAVKVELITSHGSWILTFNSKYTNKSEMLVDVQQQLYQFVANIAKEFGPSALKLTI
jgi:hypothetical protein